MDISSRPVDLIVGYTLPSSLKAASRMLTDMRVVQLARKTGNKALLPRKEQGIPGPMYRPSQLSVPAETSEELAVSA